MKNVPWHEEVVSFVQQLADLLPEYEIASEHEHSNCILIAHKKVSCSKYFIPSNSEATDVFVHVPVFKTVVYLQMNC